LLGSRESEEGMRIFLFCLAILAAVGMDAQDRGEPIAVHVKEVHRTQDEGTEKGTWFHITAVGETKTILYSLKCDEFLSMEKHAFVFRCAHLSAGRDYSARKFSDAINFWPAEEKPIDGVSLALYEIVSEKEK
jgi:hypothetical protein